jgi:hypothetical protein
LFNFRFSFMKSVFTISFLLINVLSFSQRAEIFALGGLNGSTVKIGNSVEADYSRLYSPTFGVIGGLGSQYVLGELGLLYSTQGTRINVISRDKKVDLKLRTLDVPLMAVVAPENFRFFLGPQLSFVTSSEQADTAGMEPARKDLWKLHPEKNIWSVRFGAGYERRRFLLQLHFVNGITGILKDSEKEVKLRSFQINLGYLLFSNYGQLEGSKKKKKEDELIPSHRTID